MRRSAAAVVAVLMLAALCVAPAGASAASRAPKLAKIRCVPVKAATCTAHPGVGNIKLSRHSNTPSTMSAAALSMGSAFQIRLSLHRAPATPLA